MLKFLLRRSLRLLMTLLLISTVVFVMLRLIPGDPAVVLAGQDASPEIVHTIRVNLSLDQPIPVQYVRYLGEVLKGNLGQSIRSKLPVTEEIADRLPATLELGFTAIAIALPLGLFLGIASALRAGTALDLGILLIALLGVSAPSFWIGLILMVVFAVQLGLVPVAGAQGPIAMILPVATLVPLSLAVFARLTRSSMLDVLSEDYIRTALAKGVSRRVILWRHALRNALIPVVTISGLEFGRLLGGIIAVEIIFAWPGAGKALADAILTRDYPMVQGLVLAFGLVFAILNTLADVINGLVDPRVRVG